MNEWQGEFVEKELGLDLSQSDSGTVSLKSIVGLSLRENPKRAHLLVSKVLGKHIPQSPTLIEKAGEILALMVFEKRNELPDTLSQEALSLLADAVEGDERALNQLVALLDGTSVISPNLATFGYAETATALGAIVANKLGTYYIHSTRYPDEGSVNYGKFEESHSHASSHYLTPKDNSILNSLSNDIVLVDDEITTGNTIKNTISMMESISHHSKYYLVSLIDLRTEQDKSALMSFAVENGISLEVVALYSGSVKIPSNALELSKPIISRIKTEKPLEEHTGVKESILESNLVDLPDPKLKNGVDNFEQVSQMADTLSSQILQMGDLGKTLVVGLEEDMYLPLQVGKKLEEVNSGKVFFSTTTRSPVLSYDTNKYAIQKKLKFVVPEIEGDTPKRFAYNIDSSFKTAIIVCKNEKEYNQLNHENGLIQNLKKHIEKIILMTLTNLPEPLVGPNFGSYSEKDVKWLLKDLSDVSLEAATEDREEAIQNGGAHYAESLPQEYQPTAEYQQLFLDALEESKQEIADSIGLVSEVIYKERAGSPVLVSLARAGTPIGVLIKRYLENAYETEVPHYAVSIVRGKGIDANALNYLAAHYDPSRIIFVDGWTGKGAITKELKDALEVYETAHGVHFSPEIAVLADPGHCVRIFGTRDDFLIPSACLNSTVSGLVSRTVLNAAYIGENDYHGAKFYKEFAENDYSNVYVDTISNLFDSKLIEASKAKAEQFKLEEPTWEGWKAIERINSEYEINSINLVKPGVGETTRVLLRRVPWRILIRPDKFDSLLHIRVLAESRGVEIELVEDLPYGCVGLIHPKFTKGATGFSGVKE
jgi:pyrimidine operon attenuation protein/uracil phosphoribosyltransferase